MPWNYFCTYGAFRDKFTGRLKVSFCTNGIGSCYYEICIEIAWFYIKSMRTYMYVKYDQERSRKNALNWMETAHKQGINLSINQLINQTIDQGTNQLIRKLIIQWINQLTK